MPLTVERTRIGWRLSNPLGERQQICGLAGSRLLWKNGEHLELLDLRSGLATLLQEPSEDGAGLPRGAVSASLSDQQAVWVKLEDDGSRTELLAHDLASGTRETLVVVDSIDQAFAFGGGVVWQQGDDILCKGPPDQLLWLQ